MGFIYKITGPTGKSYVGKTIRSVETRIQAHLSSKSYCRALKDAFDELGPENFTYEVLWEGGDDELGDMERKFIDQENTLHPHGYNLTTGGGRSEKASESTIELLKSKQRQRNIDVRGHLGTITPKGDKWYFKCVKGGRIYDTREEADTALVEYNSDPDGYSLKDRKHGAGSVYQQNGKWCCRACVDGRSVYIGSFKSEEEAHDALKHFKETGEKRNRRRSPDGSGSVRQVKNGKWRAQSPGAKRQHIGYFNTREEAEKALDERLKGCDLT